MAISTLLIGLGNIAMGYDLGTPHLIRTHLRAIQTHDAFNLIAAIDPDESKCFTFEKNTSLPTFTTMESYINQNKKLPELVVIASPTSDHYSCWTYCHKQSVKVVLMEKPLFTNIEDMNKFDLDLRTSNINIMVNLFRLYDSELVEVLKSINVQNKKPCITVWYSKGLLHNGVHFFTLFSKYFGPFKSYSINDSKFVLMDFELAEVIFEPSSTLLDDNSFKIVHDQGYVYYLNGGNIMLMTNKFGEIVYLEKNRLNTYQMGTYNAIEQVINGYSDDSYKLAKQAQLTLGEIEQELLNESLEKV